MERKMKILAASDIHGDSLAAKELAGRADKENVDLVVLCGDLTSQVEQSNLIKPFKDIGKRVLFVTGNHEGFALGNFLAEVYDVKNLHGAFAKYYTVGFFGCGGANIGVEALQDEEFYETLKQGFNSIKDMDKKIMVTHVHPQGTIIDKVMPGMGSLGIRRAVERFKPDLLLCGHLHEVAGVEDYLGKTKVINVGKKGKIIEI